MGVTANIGATAGAINLAHVARNTAITADAVRELLAAQRLTNELLTKVAADLAIAAAAADHLARVATPR